MLLLDGRSLQIADVMAVADGVLAVGLAPEARARMQVTRDVVDRAVARAEPVYGINTGFGKLSEVTIAGDQLAALQRNLVRSHAAGVGDPLPEREVRAMMLLRANVLATAFAGARPIVVESLLAMLNAGVWPVVPEQGSVGASGDLAPLAHLALTLIGEGTARLHGREAPSLELLDAAGLVAVTLEAKEGLALINGTQAHTAVATLACAELTRLWHAAHVATAMSLEALLGTPDAFDARIQEARGQSGQMESAAMLRMLLDGSEIRESHRFGDPRVQDAYALRCVPQVHGPALDALRFARGVIARELNAATDNPLVLSDGQIVSGGNFHAEPVGFAADMIALALSEIGAIAQRRVALMVDPVLSFDLPAFLTPRPGLNSGLMIAEVTTAALMSENKHIAMPCVTDSTPTSANQEDHVSMAAHGARRLSQMVANLNVILGVEAICAAQGIDFRAPLTTSPPLRRAHARLRQEVATLGDDRYLAPDLAAAAALIHSGAFAAAAEISLPTL